MKNLTYHQAIEKMASGHRVKRKNWTDGNYLYSAGDDRHLTFHVSERKVTKLSDSDHADFSRHEDWIAYKEVKEPLKAV